ncbi:MAG: ATP-binding cassette domain-containing protein [Rhizobiaceae bacterium]|nr:ATP-binding cassette domain-containing protein [Rhizobiaceae bacterium]
MSESVVQTRGLTMRFGGVTAVDAVDFSLRRNELRCLIGPNGAGKSTFFKCITGMLKCTSGEVWINGHETTNWDPHQVARLGVGIKTQVPSVLDGFTVRENVWLAAHRVTAADGVASRVAEAMERLAVSSLADSMVGSLSHGERQRVELSMILASRPWLILLDEPAAGLTAAEIATLGHIVTDLSRDAAIVIVEHDMQFIRSIAGLVTVFAQGRILMEDQVDKVMADARVREVYLGRKN